MPALKKQLSLSKGCSLPKRCGRRPGVGVGDGVRGRQRARPGRTLEAAVWSLISSVKGPRVVGKAGCRRTGWGGGASQVVAGPGRR